jgi:hypothetical protein
MATHNDEFHHRAGTSGIRSPFRVPGRVGTRRPATAGGGPSQAAQADRAFFERQPPGTVAVRHDGAAWRFPEPSETSAPWTERTRSSSTGEAGASDSWRSRVSPTRP